ncbi:MAG: DUF2945 domain-containing protein [Pseudomonadota bacterium]
MADAFQTNTKVQWNWGQGTGEGYVREVFREPVQREIKGTTVSRDASDDNPAYLIEQEDGDEVLKAHSELERAS